MTGTGISLLGIGVTLAMFVGFCALAWWSEH